MVFLKSSLVGLLALLLAFASLPVVAFFVLLIYSLTHPSSEGSVGWDPISIYRQSPLLPIALMAIVFASGFYWEYRRLTHK
jgi:hypothetical protein